MRKTWPLDGDTRDKVRDALRKSIWFGSLDEAQLDSVLELGTLVGFDKEDVIVGQGDPSDVFFLLVKGAVRFEGGERVDPIELGRARAPFSFGELGVLLDKERSATVVAMSPALALELQANDLGRMIETLPGFGLSLIRTLASRLAKVTELVPLPDHTEGRPIDPQAFGLLPLPFMLRHRVVGLAVEDNDFTVGFVEQVTPEVLAGIRQHVPGVTIQPVTVDAERYSELMRSRGGVEGWEARAQVPPVHLSPVVPQLSALLERMVAEGASDLHLSPGRLPHWRIDGDIRELEDLPPLGPEEVVELFRPVLEPWQVEELEEHQDVDAAFSVADVGRFRVNLYRTSRGTGAAVRLVPSQILTPRQLALPETVLRFCDYPHGLVLVTGPTGSGKTTTLAALIDHINRSRRRHIITLEDPIEFVHQDRRSLIDQRQLGSHVPDFSRGLRAAMREDPDIVLVGEIRDAETMALVLKVAGTGHLVFATLHTSTVTRTLDQVVEMFPGTEQSQARSNLADVLRAVSCQHLVKKRGGGRLPAMELLIASPATRSMVRDGKTMQIESAMLTAKADGNLLLNETLTELVRGERVTFEEALSVTYDRRDLSKRLGRDV
ncbi:MAG: PilT/PilU family type 4a pilus ATPase [Acidobacteriota bacterium]